jgi:CBS domain-containing protein
MRDIRANAVLVASEDGRLVGIFSGRDALWRVVAEGADCSRTTLGEVMTSKPVTITPYTTPLEALRLMRDGGFRHLPVVDKGNIVGLVARRDFRGDDFARLEEERDFWERVR